MLCEWDGDVIDSDIILLFEVFECFFFEVVDIFIGFVERGVDFGERYRIVVDEIETVLEDVCLWCG